MERQITIADYLGEKELSRMSEAEMVSEVGNRLGLPFSRKEWDYNTHEYRAKYKGLVLTLELSTYYGSDQPIILYGYDNKKELSGGGGPAESIDEAVEQLQRIITREAEHEQRKRELGHRRTA